MQLDSLQILSLHEGARRSHLGAWLPNPFLGLLIAVAFLNSSQQQNHFSHWLLPHVKDTSDSLYFWFHQVCLGNIKFHYWLRGYFSALPFLCHCCSWDVQARSGCSSWSLKSSLLLLSYKLKLHTLNISARTLLQYPTWTALQEQYAWITSPETIQKQKRRSWGVSLFLRCGSTLIKSSSTFDHWLSVCASSTGLLKVFFKLVGIEW